MWKWFRWILLVIIIISIGLIIIFVIRHLKNKNNSSNKNITNENIIKNIGFNLDYYNPTTNKAGDIEFFNSPDQLIFMDFGYRIPAEKTANKQESVEAHPSIILPLGTKVLSPIDGIVVAVPTLYSNDRSIQITPTGKMEGLIFELEHVKNPLVKEGDKVSAGQPVAEVTDFSSQNHPGYGYFDLAVFRTKSNGEPEHLCPFLYLSDNMKEETYAKIRALYTAWEEYIKDNNIYDNNNYTVPGCISIDSIAG